MKLLYNVLSIAMVGLALNATAQNYCLKYISTQNDNGLEVSIRMVAQDKAFKLGSGNVQFTYNMAALQHPTVLRNNLSMNPAYKGVTFTEPQAPSLAKIAEGLVSLNFYYGADEGQGVFVPTEGGVELALLRFDWKNQALTPNLRVYEKGTKGTVVYNDNRDQPILLTLSNVCQATNVTQNAQIRVYPTLLAVKNAQLTLEVPDFEAQGKQDFEILTMAGQQVQIGKTAPKQTINIAHLVAGAYILRVGKEQIKFILQ